MSKALSSSTPHRSLTRLDTRTDMLVRRFSNHLEETADFRRRAIPDRLAPTDDERRELKARVAEIDSGLGRASEASIRRAVGLVKGLMASPAIGETTVDEILSGYALVLAPYPQPVIEDVCRRYLDGRLGNRVYAPTPAEIAHECREMLAPIYAERARIALILDAEVYETPSPEQQAEVQAAYLAFVAETSSRAEGGFAGAKEAEGSQAHADRLSALSTLKQAEAKAKSEQTDGVEA
jgi:hypothetical protein